MLGLSVRESKGCEKWEQWPNVILILFSVQFSYEKCDKMWQVPLSLTLLLLYLTRSDTDLQIKHAD